MGVLFLPIFYTWEPGIYFLSLYVCIFWVFHINESYIVSYGWIPSLKHLLFFSLISVPLSLCPPSLLSFFDSTGNLRSSYMQSKCSVAELQPQLVNMFVRFICVLPCIIQQTAKQQNPTNLKVIFIDSYFLGFAWPDYELSWLKKENPKKGQWAIPGLDVV